MPDFVIPPGGVSAASFWTAVPFVDPAHPLGVLADKLDPNTGELLSLIAGRDPVDAAIAYQFRLRRASGAAVLEDGQAFEAIRKNTDSAPAELRFEAERVMRPFVERGDAEIVGLIIEAGEDAGDMGAVFLEYRNLCSGQTPRFQVA